MIGGGSFLGAMGWGLRRYAWVVVCCILGVGVLVPALLNRGPAGYEAQAQVGAIEPIRLTSLDALARIGDSVFDNGAVAVPVRQLLHLPPAAAVMPRYVELVPEQDNPVFTVLGHSTNARTAQRLADTAAAAFTTEFNKYSGSVSRFRVQHAAPLPANPVEKIGGGRTALAIGLAAGLTAGLGLMMLVLVWRRPALDAASASEATGAPVYGQVRLAGTPDTSKPWRSPGLVPLCRRLLASPYDTVVLVGPAGAPHIERFGQAMTSLLQHIQRSSSTAARDATGRLGTAAAPGHPTGVVRVQLGMDEPPAHLTGRDAGALTLLVVPEGTPATTLNEAANEYLSGVAGGLVIVSG